MGLKGVAPKRGEVSALFMHGWVRDEEATSLGGLEVLRGEKFTLGLKARLYFAGGRLV